MDLNPQTNKFESKDDGCTAGIWSIQSEWTKGRGRNSRENRGGDHNFVYI